MALYITLANYTDQGIRNLKEMADRLGAARRAIEAAGGKLLAYHLTLGQYDAVVLIEAPDDATYATVVLSIAGGGNIRTTTLKAFSEEESIQVMRNLP